MEWTAVLTDPCRGSPCLLLIAEPFLTGSSLISYGANTPLTYEAHQLEILIKVQMSNALPRVGVRKGEELRDFAQDWTWPWRTHTHCIFYQSWHGI